MDNITKPIVRKRVNVATSVKGVRTWDVTVEITGEWDAALLAGTNMLLEHDALVAALEQRYPTPAP